MAPAPWHTALPRQPRNAATAEASKTQSIPISPMTIPGSRQMSKCRPPVQGRHRSPLQLADGASLVQRREVEWRQSRPGFRRSFAPLTALRHPVPRRLWVQRYPIRGSRHRLSGAQQDQAPPPAPDPLEGPGARGRPRGVSVRPHADHPAGSTGGRDAPCTGSGRLASARWSRCSSVSASWSAPPGLSSP